ncbi:MAG: hypothetical protein JO006_19240 [Paucibacter sp.]|nr:hypothetical protein [Roseateles sp.]
MESDEFTSGWESIHVGFEGSALSIDGINPWVHVGRWQRAAPESVVVPHPSYRQQRHRASVYEVEAHGKTIRFAATELSNGVWGFYVPSDANA